jgi:hypothetical protein
VSRLAHPLDRDEKRFVSRQARRRERGHLVTQVTFKLFDVAPVNRSPAAQVPPPLRDLLFERPAGGHHAGLVFIQMAWRVSSTTFQRWRCAASCVRPSRVMR